MGLDSSLAPRLDYTGSEHMVQPLMDLIVKAESRWDFVAVLLVVELELLVELLETIPWN